MTHPSSPTRPLAAFRVPAFFFPLLVFGATLALYLRTLLPGAVGGDAGELQYAGPLLALTHPTGQPLYVLLGFLWSHLVPWGSAAWRMNLLAAVSGAAASGLLAWAVYRCHRQGLVAIATGLTLGLGATLWGQAVIADKYAFSAFFASLVTGLALVWVQARTQPAGNRWLYGLCLAYGLSLLHHRSLFMFAPGLGLMVLFLERSALWRQWRRTLLCAALVLLPALIVYPLYLPWVEARHLSPLMWQPTSAADWLNWWLERHVLTGEVLTFGATANASLAQRLALYVQTLLADYTVVGLAGAGLGLVALWRRSKPALAFLAITYLLVGGLAANYRGNERQFTYYLPSFVVLVYAYGEGLAGLWQAAQQLRGRRPVRFLLQAVCISLALGVAAWQFSYAYPLRRQEATYGQPLDIWRQTLKTGNQAERLASGLEGLPPNAVVISDWEQMTILWYYQHVEGRRPDVELVYPVERLADFTAGQREICLTRSLPVGAEWHPTNVGPLVWLQRQPARTVPDAATPVGTALYTPDGQPVLELSGYQMDSDVYAASQYAPLVISWRALANLKDDYALSLHILDEQWRPIWTQDSAAPVLGMYPTSRWVQGEVVQDYHELALPRELPPARYLWTVVVYRQLPGGSFAQLRDQQGNVEILGGTFEVTPR